jgi:tetratricopeptide (TPR) repeat protein
VRINDYNTSLSYVQELTFIKKTTGNKHEAQKLHELALDSFKKKKYGKSETLWYLAAKADPGCVDYYYNLARTLLSQGRYDFSLRYLELALSMDPGNMLQRIKNSSDFALLKKYKIYTDLEKKYSPESDTSIPYLLKKALSIMHDSISNRDAILLKTIINKRDGLRIVIESGTTHIDNSYDVNTIDISIVDLISQNEMYVSGDFTVIPHMSKGDPGIKVLYLRTRYHIDPPASPMRCESWMDNLYFFKNINGRWFLIKIESEGNGGC